MARNQEAPSAKEVDRPGIEGVEYSLPAFATVTLSNVHGGDYTMFGSDSIHPDRVRIAVQRATLKRGLANDWIHGHGRELIEFEMTHAQWASFVSSSGRGKGTPVTLTRAWSDEGKYAEVPAIKRMEEKVDTYRREVEEAAKQRLEAIRAEIAKLGALIESGKLGKTELRALHSTLAREAGYLPGTISYVVQQGQETIEKMAASAKIDVESFVALTAQRMGFEQIREKGIEFDQNNGVRITGQIHEHP